MQQLGATAATETKPDGVTFVATLVVRLVECSGQTPVAGFILLLLVCCCRLDHHRHPAEPLVLD